jgi:hypothetical protein
MDTTGLDPSDITVQVYDSEHTSDGAGNRPIGTIYLIREPTDPITMNVNPQLVSTLAESSRDNINRLVEDYLLQNAILVIYLYMTQLLKHKFILLMAIHLFTTDHAGLANVRFLLMVRP